MEGAGAAGMRRTDRGPSSSTPSTGMLIGIGIVVGAAIIAWKSPVVLILLLTDGLAAAAVIGCATLGGLALLPWLQLGPDEGIPRHWEVLLGAGIGLGLLALLVLIGGLCGLLLRSVWIGVLVLAVAAGIVRLVRRPLRREARESEATAAPLRWLWLLLIPFAVLTVLVATVPPGYLWAEEGLGYDVLEYHLEMPKEYLRANCIVYAPHNVYANFPANVEMLYLLCMVVNGDPIEATITCQLLNAELAVLVVAAAWLIARPRSRFGAVTAAVATGGVGWLTYLSGVAYVENGMLLFGLLGVAAITRVQVEPHRTLRWCALAGILVGFSIGCKYTAAPLIALPVAVALPVTLRGTLRHRLTCLGVFIAAQTVAFGPWAIKNLVFTGNPVFPLAGNVFTHDPPGWGRAESARFSAAHAPAPDERPLGARLGNLWHKIPGDPDQRFGPLVLVLALASLAGIRRSRVICCAGLMLSVQLVVWTCATHLYARFAVPLLVPLAVMAGRTPLDGPRGRRALVVLLCAGTAWSGVFLFRLYEQHLRPAGEWIDLEGATNFFTEGLGLQHEHLAVVNKSLPEDSRILLLGDAKAFYFRRQVDYCVVFNRNPFVELLRTRASDAKIMTWLSERGYTHVLVNWQEIARLKSSRYGFSAEITPELFGRLQRAGLIHTNTFYSAANGRPYAELYSAPR